MSEYVKTRRKRTARTSRKWRIIPACAGVVALVGSFIYFNSESNSGIEEQDISRPSPEELDGKVEPMMVVNSELREILDKHLETMGGIHNWSKVESIRLNGTIERDGQLVDICIVKKRPNQIRATVTLPLPDSDEEKLQIIRAHDGKTAWTATRLAGAPDMVKEELPPEAAAELLADAGVLPPLIKLWRDGTELELLESKIVNGENAYRLRTKAKAPLQYTFYVSSDSYQLLAYDSIKNDGTSIRTTLAGFVQDNGVLIPRESIIESPATGTSTMTANSIEVGVGIYQEYFGPGEMPRTAQTK